jgi:hypothetical protein
VAYDCLDVYGQAPITGIRGRGPIKRAYQQLEQWVADERVLAIAAVMDRPPNTRKQRQMGGASALGSAIEAGKPGRLLVLTEANLYEVYGTGMLNGKQPRGIRISLADITDVRVLTNRHLMSKERLLAIDYTRGAWSRRDSTS